jgi:hypothetical protein
VLAGRRRRAVDSTILADAVATQDTITQLVSAIRRVARQVPGAAAQIQAVCSAHDYTQPGKPQIDWDDPAAKDALVSALVNDAGALVAALEGAELDERAQAAVALLALVAGQDVEPAEAPMGPMGAGGSPQGRPRSGHLHRRPRRPPHPQVAGEPPRRLPGARGRRARDRDHHRRGAHQGCRDRQFRPGGRRAVCGRRSRPGHPRSQHATDSDISTREWYGDSAYGTGDLRDAIATAGHVAVLKPKPLQPAVAGGFTVDDFTVNPRPAR